MITGLRVRFEAGGRWQIDADQSAERCAPSPTATTARARLGEVALVDRESRIGQLGTVFYDTLLDENAASHIALGQGFDLPSTTTSDRARVNRSEIHIDFMIGSERGGGHRH